MLMKCAVAAEHGVMRGEELRVVDTGTVDKDDFASLVGPSAPADVERGFAGTGLLGLA